jgi:hypothetical protein
MAIVFDAITKSTSQLNPSFTHTPIGTPRGVEVWVSHEGNTDEITGITYGGVAMTEQAGSPSLLTATEPSALYCYFLGASIPTGAQTVTVSGSGVTTKVAWCITVTAATNTEFVDSTVFTSGSTDNPSGTLSLGGRTCFCAMGATAGRNDVGQIAPLSNWSADDATHEHDFGSQMGVSYTFNTVASADVTFGYTATADEVNMMGLAIAEVAGAVGNPVPVGRRVKEWHRR